MHLLRNKVVKCDLFRFFLSEATVKTWWAVAYVYATDLHTWILMLATAEMAMGDGLWQNTVSELKLKNRCTGSTPGCRLKACIGSYCWIIALELKFYDKHKDVHMYTWRIYSSRCSHIAVQVETDDMDWNLHWFIYNCMNRHENSEVRITFN